MRGLLRLADDLNAGQTVMSLPVSITLSSMQNPGPIYAGPYRGGNPIHWVHWVLHERGAVPREPVEGKFG